MYLESGFYVIRPLHNQYMALHAENGVSDVTTIGYSNTLSGVPARNRWTIKYSNGGYIIQCQGEASQTLSCSTSHPGSTVFTGNHVSTIYWLFESVSNIPTQVLLFDRSTGEMHSDMMRYIRYGDTVSLSDLDIMATFASGFSSVPSITWMSSAPSEVSVNSQTGAITGNVDGGMAIITAKCIFAGIEYGKSYTVYVVEEDVPVLRIRHYYD